jgi:hypothetical protein
MAGIADQGISIRIAPCMFERVWLVMMALTIQPAAAALMQLPGVPSGLGCCSVPPLLSSAHMFFLVCADAELSNLLPLLSCSCLESQPAWAAVSSLICRQVLIVACLVKLMTLDHQNLLPMLSCSCLEPQPAWATVPCHLCQQLLIVACFVMLMTLNHQNLLPLFSCSCLESQPAWATLPCHLCRQLLVVACLVMLMMLNHPNLLPLFSCSCLEPQPAWAAVPCHLCRQPTRMGPA